MMTQEHMYKNLYKNGHFPTLWKNGFLEFKRDAFAIAKDAWKWGELNHLIGYYFYFYIH